MKDGRSGWSELAAQYDATRAFPGDGDVTVPAALAATLRDLGAARVLDLGCGTGRFLLPLARSGVHVIGADRSPEMLAVLLAKPDAHRLRVVRCDAERLPFGRSFDAVVFSHFLHLVPSIPTLAAEVRRVLLPGAHVVVVDTGSGPRPATIRVLAVALPSLGEDFRPWPHGADSKDRQLFRDLLDHLGGAEIAVHEITTFPASVTLRQEIGHVRDRTWWRFRVHSADAAARAAAVSEAQLVAEGADLDAAVEEPVVVRFLVGYVP